MLSFRFVIISAVAGVSLWGLFALLDTLREPALLRAEKATTIKGCEVLDSEETRAVCPQLFCQKAVIEAKLVSYKTRFAVTVDKEDDEGTRLIGGNAGNNPSTNPTARFACLFDESKIVAVKLVDPAELDDLAAQPGDWSL